MIDVIRDDCKNQSHSIRKNWVSNLEMNEIKKEKPLMLMYKNNSEEGNYDLV